MTRPDTTASLDWTLAEHWYDQNAESFTDATLSMKPSPLLLHFAQDLAPGARVLDAGCGAGRDTKWLIAQGFKVGAFDISQKMVEATHATTGGQVNPRRLDFRDYNDAPASWDAIWALASILHLPRENVPDTLARLLASLTPYGKLTFAVKHGIGEKLDERGRPMSYFEPEEISQMTLKAMSGKGQVVTSISDLPDSAGNSTTWIEITARRLPPLLTRGLEPPAQNKKKTDPRKESHP